MKRKGITPVIAVVLLLLITVGAVASAWGLYQNIISDQSQVDELQQRQAAENTEIRRQQVYNSGGYINVSLRNNGGQAVNLTKDVELQVDPDGGDDYLSPPLLVGNYDIGDPRDSGCFGGSGKTLTTEGDSRELQCNTSIQFPSAGDTISFRLSYRNVEGYNWDFDCSPSSSNAVTC